MGKKKSNKSTKRPEKNALFRRRLWDAISIVLTAVALFLLVALCSYHLSDPGWSFQGNGPVQNVTGWLGAYCADFLLSMFGFLAYLLPFVVMGIIWLRFRERSDEETHWPLLLVRWLGIVLLVVGGSGLSTLILVNLSHGLPQGAGGIMGDMIASNSLVWLNFIGAILVLTAIFLLGLTLFIGLRWLKVVVFGAMGIMAGCRYLGTQCAVAYAAWRKRSAEQKAQRVTAKQAQREEPVLNTLEPVTDMPVEEPPIMEEPPFEKAVKRPSAKAASTAGISIVAPAKDKGHPDPDETPRKASGHQAPKRKRFQGKLPSINLLDKPESAKGKMSKDALSQMAQLVEEKLADFGIKVKVVGVCPGPIVTRYELQLAPGVKVSKLSGLGKDLARSLSAFSVRIVEVIPGKSVVGIEIPNETRQIVRLKEVLDTEQFMGSNTPLLMGLGKDIAGDPEQASLSKMPHLLVAGTTGSGKSVGLNAILLSFLLKSTPDELRMILIDPKMLELSIYEGVPHLLTPVVTDMKEAANALRWCVKEMDRRYRVMSLAGVRNIAGLNDKIKQARASGKPLLDPLWQQTHPGDENAPELEPMPYIVVLVDEFADMMMVVGKKVEELIARLAQKARAAGIHLILATQRPSVDVITGLIKANIPTRIAFQVSSKIDSRTILDQQGAEQLLGHGDMLYLPPGSGVPTRVHGAFVADHEVHKIVAAWRKLGAPDYIESILSTETDAEGAGDDDAEKDELYDQAVKIVIDSQRASISAVQRRLKIGYNRAARLIEAMEAAGLVSEVQSNGMRDVLVAPGSAG